MSRSTNQPAATPPATIEITVEPDGSTSVQTRGFVGASCRDASAFIERALGEVTGERLTAEYHEPARQTQTVRQQA